jgi:predicted transcriptional regulator
MTISLENKVSIIDLSEKGLSVDKIAKELNVSQFAVFSFQKEQRMTYI